MKILCLSTKTNPCNQGGIETFCRVLKKFYNNIEFFSFLNKEKRYYDVKNIIELKADKWYEKIIYKLFGKTYLSKLKKMEYDIYILNFPKDIELIPKDKKNIILVQHINYSKYVEEYFRNDLKLINECKKRLKYFVFLSEYDRDKFVKEMNFPLCKTKVIRHSCELEIQNIKK
ncbi:hypothetical protein [Fusobacterium sp.]|uniref:hypothetical protein n=1 Tax=Fusobacterium sp. TaxID=68766 RepID=UPI00263528F1|nr:hypothetical protein [Fusobacterium sp.]